MTITNPRGDSGTQPQPHYCTQRLRDDGTIAGCPEWPACLFAERAPIMDVTPDPMLLQVMNAKAKRVKHERGTAHSPAVALGLGMLAAVVAIVVIGVCCALGLATR